VPAAKMGTVPGRFVRDPNCCQIALDVILTRRYFSHSG
jgi:hypothetical protein